MSSQSFGPSSAYGQWAGIAKTAIEIALSVNGVPGAGAVANLLVGLTPLGEAQSQLLASIKKDTQLLRKEPFRTAKTAMAEAWRVGPNDPRYGEFLNEARQSLYRALSLTASLQEKAVVEFDIALIYASLTMQSDALHWLRQSRTSCRLGVEGLLVGFLVPRQPYLGRIQDKRPFPRQPPMSKKQIAVWLASIQLLGSTGLSIAYLAIEKGRAMKREVHAAQGFVAFANMVERVTAVAADELAPKPLEIVHQTEGDGGVFLREII
jgi:hypothetical protein